MLPLLPRTLATVLAAPAASHVDTVYLNSSAYL